MDIKESNKMIAEFMGLKCELFMSNPPRPTGCVMIDGIPVCAKYHLSYDWLMPVIEKIYLIREVQINLTVGSMEIVYVGQKAYRKKICVSEKTGLECWYDSVVEFIKWYKELQKL